MNIFKLTLFLFLKFFYIFNIKMFTRFILIMRLCSTFLFIVKPFCIFCYSFKKFFSFPMGKNSCKYCINFYIRPFYIIYIGHIRSNVLSLISTCIRTLGSLLMSLMINILSLNYSLIQF